MRSSRSSVPRAPWVLLLFAATGILLSACARPPSATVSEGADPFNVDKDVVFRTTYYFRVFDYCVARKLKEKDFEEVVIPLTDSLYRFRMTGKTGSNFSDVKFESGTLMAWEIDPFGAKVEFDPESRRARVISQREVNADARRSGIKRDIYEILAIYDRLNDRLAKKPDGSMPTDHERTMVTDMLNTLSAELRGKVERFGRLDSGPNEDDAQYVDTASRPLSDENRSALLRAEVVKVLEAALPSASAEMINEIVDEGFGSDSAVLDASDPARPGFVERATIITIENATKRIQDQNSGSAQFLSLYMANGDTVDTAKIEGLVRPKAARLAQSERYLEPLLAGGGPPGSIQCPEDAPVRRGFQVLGPEGWRTFNQDERLMLAMSSSAAPLISTLKDLSNRVIGARDNPSAELLPIVLEQKRLSEAGRALDTRHSKPNVAPDDLAKAVCRKLLADSDSEEGKCDE